MHEGIVLREGDANVQGFLRAGRNRTQNSKTESKAQSNLTDSKVIRGCIRVDGADVPDDQWHNRRGLTKDYSEGTCDRTRRSCVFLG